MLRVKQAKQSKRVAERLAEDSGEKSISKGDFVSWDNSGGEAVGKVIEIKDDGELSGLKGSTKVEGTEDAPAAKILVYKDGEPSEDHVGHKVKSLTKTKAPEKPESEKESRLRVRASGTPRRANRRSVAADERAKLFYGDVAETVYNLADELDEYYGDEPGVAAARDALNQAVALLDRLSQTGRAAGRSTRTADISDGEKRLVGSVSTQARFVQASIMEAINEVNTWPSPEGLPDTDLGYAVGSLQSSLDLSIEELENCKGAAEPLYRYLPGNYRDSAMAGNRTAAPDMNAGDRVATPDGQYGVVVETGKGVRELFAGAAYVVVRLTQGGATSDETYALDQVRKAKKQAAPVSTTDDAYESLYTRTVERYKNDTTVDQTQIEDAVDKAYETGGALSTSTAGKPEDLDGHVDVFLGKKTSRALSVIREWTRGAGAFRCPAEDCGGSLSRTARVGFFRCNSNPDHVSEMSA